MITSFQLYCTARFVPFAGVSQDSRFFSQFSIVGFGSSPGSKRPSQSRVQRYPPNTRTRTRRPAHIREELLALHHIPALRKVISGIAVDLIQIPHPHPSHHARSISVPLSAFCVYVRGWGLDVWISSVLVNRCAECLSCWGLVIIRFFQAAGQPVPASK